MQTPSVSVGSFFPLKGAFDHKTLGFLGGANGRERLRAEGIDQAPS